MKRDELPKRVIGLLFASKMYFFEAHNEKSPPFDLLFFL